MNLLRPALAGVTVLLLSGCATQPNLASSERALKRAEIETKIRADARSYSQFAIARYAALTQDPETAARQYAKVLSSSFADPVITERAIFSALLIGDVAGAKTVALGLPDDARRDSDLARLVLATDAVANDNNGDAVLHLMSNWSSDFHETLAQGMTAWLLLPTDPDSAIATQTSAGGNDPILSRLGQTFAARMQIDYGQTDAAQETLARLWEARARTAIGVEAEARLFAADGATTLAKQRLRSFRETVGRHPALSALSQELEQGDVALPKRLDTKEGIALYLYAMAAALGEDHGSDVAGVYFALALHLDPSLDAARTIWADMLDRSDRRTEAIELLRTVPPSSLYHTNAQGQLAWLKLREGNAEAALALARETLRTTQDRNIKVQLADLLQTTGRLGEAETVLTEIIDEDAANGHYDWRIYFARGSAREQLGFWAPAQDDLETALGLNPNNPKVLNYLGFSWVDRGIHLERGLTLIENALLLAPNDGAITDSLGWALYKLGQYDRAVFHLERAVELRPQDPHVLDHLGDAYWLTGRYTEAGYQWQRALDYARTERDRELFAKKLEHGTAQLSSYEPPSAFVRP
ncbi:MAG: tetratricopeptide repeat protein [Pseudomonadota bacterium]